MRSQDRAGRHRAAVPTPQGAGGRLTRPRRMVVVPAAVAVAAVSSVALGLTLEQGPDRSDRPVEGFRDQSATPPSPTGLGSPTSTGPTPTLTGAASTERESGSTRSTLAPTGAASAAPGDVVPADAVATVAPTVVASPTVDPSPTLEPSPTVEPTASDAGTEAPGAAHRPTQAPTPTRRPSP